MFLRVFLLEGCRKMSNKEMYDQPYAVKELQFQAIRQEIHKSLVNYDRRSPGEKRTLHHIVPPSFLGVTYDRSGKMRNERMQIEWTPTLENTVRNVYKVSRFSGYDDDDNIVMLDTDPSRGEIERMVFKYMRDWRYEMLGTRGRDNRGNLPYDFGSLDDL